MTASDIARAALGCLIAAAGGSARADDYIGSLKLLGTSFCPHHTIEAAGQLLPIAQNAALFSLLGTTYGGDGRITFGVPDLRGKEPAPGSRYCLYTVGTYPQRP